MPSPISYNRICAERIESEATERATTRRAAKWDWRLSSDEVESWSNLATFTFGVASVAVSAGVVLGIAFVAFALVFG